MPEPFRLPTLPLFAFFDCQVTFAQAGHNLALLAGWAMSIGVTNASLAVAGSTGHCWWVNAVYVCLLVVSYESERKTLRHFIKVCFFALFVCVRPGSSPSFHPHTRTHITHTTQSMLALDIMERYSELQLKLAATKVEQSSAALEAKRAIVRHIAHEVRGPLNTIAIAGDILGQELEAFPDLPKVRVWPACKWCHPPLCCSYPGTPTCAPICPKMVHEIVDGLKESASTAMEQINEMMLFEKLSAGMRSIEPQAVPVLTYVRECMKPHLVPALAKEIDLAFEAPSDESQPAAARLADNTCVMLDPVKVISNPNPYPIPKP